MRPLTLLMIMFVSVLTISCATVPTGDIKIVTEAAPQENLGQYKSYGWLLGVAALHDPDGSWEPPGFDADSEVIYLVNREMRKRGLTETNRDPDVYIGFGIGLDMAALKISEDVEGNISALENVPQGGLVLVLIDRKEAEVFWVGLATGDKLEGIDDEVRKKRLDYAISNMFKSVP